MSWGDDARAHLGRVRRRRDATAFARWCGSGYLDAGGVLSKYMNEVTATHREPLDARAGSRTFEPRAGGVCRLAVPDRSPD